jgi:SOS-response transcriptional repressor LexA
MSTQPSEKQMELLDYLIRHIEEHGFQPSYSEMAEHFGVTKNAIQGRLRGLARKGIIELPRRAKVRERAVVLKQVRFKAWPAGPQETQA